MNSLRHLFPVVLLTVTTALVSTSPAQTEDAQSDASSTASAPAPPSWPRHFEKDGNTVLLYQPQVDSWKDHDVLRFRAVIAVTPAGASKEQLGVVAVKADTTVDDDSHIVELTNIDPAVSFPGISDDKADALKSVARDCLPKLDHLDIALEQVLAYLHSDSDKQPPAKISLAPPPIYYSDVPAILVIYVGQPQFKPVPNTKLMFGVNTNWLVFMDTTDSSYYLLDGDSWLTASDPIKGPWTAANALPDDFNNLPTGSTWDKARSHIPGEPIKSVPRVIVSTEPAELILTHGTPEYAFIQGVRLMYVSNPTMPLFLDLSNSDYYYLVAGRWFRAPKLTGPWSEASTNLPAEFAKIPQDCPVGFVLASVPGTQEAEDAVLLASVPHKATVNIKTTTVNVTYDGHPKFEPISGTDMKYAVNTAYEVVYVPGNTYYCCYSGVWFMSSDATGPWAVATSVPQEIYTIPPSCPVYNVTYVKVYSTTPTTVVVGYTGGYSGQYVAATGALMFGAGMLTGMLLSDNDNCCWYGCSPCYYSYGCCAHYSYAYGGYYRAGGAYYGPYGGAGWGSAYNPATGTWARGGAAYGPGGARWGAQAYNPWTNTYAAHTGGSNGYSSWGHSYVQQGNKWAEGGHESTARGGVGYAQNSKGQWAEGAHSNVTNSSVARTSNGDLYAGHDGNVYRNTGNGWQKYSGNGNWNDSSWNKSRGYSNEPYNSSAAAQRNYNNEMQNRASNARSASSGGDDQWKSNWENRSGSAQGAQNRWADHDTQRGLNQDAWARNRGNANALSSWGNRSGRSGDGRFGGFNRGGGGFGGFNRGGGFRGGGGGFRGRR